jgi:hypothetical protein
LRHGGIEVVVPAAAGWGNSATLPTDCFALLAANKSKMITLHNIQGEDMTPAFLEHTKMPQRFCEALKAYNAAGQQPGEQVRYIAC